MPSPEVGKSGVDLLAVGVTCLLSHSLFATPYSLFFNTFALAAAVPLEVLLSKGLRGDGRRELVSSKRRHLTAPRRIFGLSVPFNLAGHRGVSPLAGTRSPVASAA